MKTVKSKPPFYTTGCYIDMAALINRTQFAYKRDLQWQLHIAKMYQVNLNLLVTRYSLRSFVQLSPSFTLICIKIFVFFFF